jgi:prophage DNA circulation protein
VPFYTQKNNQKKGVIMKRNILFAMLFALTAGFAHAATHDIQHFEAQFAPIDKKAKAAIAGVNAAGSSKALSTLAQSRLATAISEVQNFFDEVSSATDEMNEQVEMLLAQETPDLNKVTPLKSHARKLELLKNKAANLLATASAKVKE